MLKAIKKKLGKKLGHGSAPSLQEANAAALGEHAQAMTSSAPAGAELFGTATASQPAAELAAAEAQQQQQQGRQLAEAAAEAALAARQQQEELRQQQHWSATASSAGASPRQAEAQQREQAASAAAFSEPGPLPVEALDYTHDTALDDCDFGAGPLELGEDCEAEAARASHDYHPAGAAEFLYGDSEPSASDGSRRGGGGGGSCAVFDTGAAEDGGGEGYVFDDHRSSAVGLEGSSGQAFGDGSTHSEQLPGHTPPSQPSSPNGGEGEEDHDQDHGQGRHSPSSGSELSPTADAAAAAAAGGGGGGEVPVSDALAAMVYLTEEEEAGGGGDALSVLSGREGREE